ncbi:pyrroline-5-carboxylate reductase family protein [Brucella pituitosa]|uniref:Pyrroline-5-carboxylate reductase n=1 Tax=Brucella pituitosa TaxID=571256 RepID=A0ABS3K5T6_9HYPH|nr:pyrroline-5-carboxylate reductase dimerization domain-containing protein [Brucella pituitosa]MBO1042270.1 NAD(P)-binding domain-containing protein [Brucella pituitosa]
MRQPVKIGIIGGAGWLGKAISSAIITAGITDAARLTLSFRNKAPAEYTQGNWTTDNQHLVDFSDVVILSVRPEDWRGLKIDMSGKLVISVMAGVSLQKLMSHHSSDRVIKAMPNAAAAVGKSYTPWIGSEKSTQADKQLAASIFVAFGLEDELAQESEIDYFAGLSGSGPAFPALLASTMFDEAVAFGIPPRIALRAVTTLLVGTGRLLEANPQPPQEIVNTFLNYRGTTAAALDAMRVAEFDLAIAKGLSAAFMKSISMGETV